MINKLREIEIFFRWNRITKFKRILQNANEIIEENKKKEKYNGGKCKNHPIYNYIRLIGRSTQTDYLQSLLINGKEPKSIKENIFIDTSNTIIINGREEKIYSLKESIEYEGELKLGRDLILPWPWEQSRYYSALCNYGSELHCRKWNEDKGNHYVELWLPLGVSFVHGGNHSIAAGILQAEGTITPYQCVKMDKFYDYIFTDGIYYREISTNNIISKVESFEFAAIYEIGRLILNNKIEFNL